MELERLSVANGLTDIYFLLGRAEFRYMKKRFPLLDHLSYLFYPLSSLLTRPPFLLCSALRTFIAIFHIPAYDSQLGPLPFLVEERLAKERG